MQTSLNEVVSELCSKDVQKWQLLEELTPTTMFSSSTVSLQKTYSWLALCIFFLYLFQKQNFIIFLIIFQGSNFHVLYEKKIAVYAGI